MKTLITSTALVALSASAAFADLETDLDAETERADGALAVTNEGSGMTTQSGAAMETVSEGAPTTPMNDMAAEGSTTNVPDLDDGTVIANPQTPATVVVNDGEAEPVRATDEAFGSGAEMAENDPVVELDSIEDDPSVEMNAGSDLIAPQIEREGYATLLEDNITLPQIEGVDVFGTDDEPIAEIGYTVNAAASGMGHPLAILDVGGFLGLGEHEVALPLSAITFLEGPSGLRGYIDATEDQLESMPEYDG